MTIYRRFTTFWFYKRLTCSMFFWSFLLRLHLYLQGVKVPLGVQFFGYTKFILSKKARLTINNGVVFRSSKYANLIGLNRGCIVSLMTDESELTIGQNVGLSGTVIGCFSKIYLGSNVRCGANTLITDSDWHLNDPRTAPPLPITIEENVWLGTNVTVLKGVRIGRNTIIGANSLVTSNIPENVIAAGNPCRVIRSLNQDVHS